jgi:hypothetical protein
MVQVNKRVRVPRSVEEVMSQMSERVPHLLEKCFMDRDWIWICNVDLRGEANVPTREFIKELGFRFSPGGHLMQDGKTRGHWGHSCLKPMGPRRRKGGVTQEKEEETDLAAAFRSLGM